MQLANKYLPKHQRRVITLPFSQIFPNSLDAILGALYLPFFLSQPKPACPYLVLKGFIPKSALPASSILRTLS